MYENVYKVHLFCMVRLIHIIKKITVPLNDEDCKNLCQKLQTTELQGAKK